jgi:hypothetical protein
MKIFNTALTFLLFQLNVYSQNKSLNYYNDVRPIINKYCIQCHYNGGVAPFSLETSESVIKRGKFIVDAIDSKFMPPWKADPGFSRFKNEIVMDTHEINKIKVWVESGMILGKMPSNGVVSNERNAVKKEKSHEFRIQKPYSIQSNNEDDFRFFYIPTGIKNDTFISSIQFIPDNKRRVHHSRIMIDTTGLIGGIDGLSEMDPKIYSYQKYPLADEFLYGWVPGNFEFRLPEGFGKKLYANSNIILNMHYSPSSKMDLDQSRVRFEFVKNKDNLREVKTLILRENQISNQPFELPENKVSTFYMSSGPLLKDISLLTVQAHAHLLGKSFRSFAITSDGDLIPLLKIDDWDFNWQTTYEFEKLIHIPKGAVIIMEGTYDNTILNPSNPFNPPRKVTYGWRTVDEMMNLIFHYVDYKKGDEFLNLKY